MEHFVYAYVQDVFEIKITLHYIIHCCVFGSEGLRHGIFTRPSTSYMVNTSREFCAPMNL